MKRILVWDLPTRLFHWLLVACFAVAWLTSGSDQRLSIHSFAGYLMLGLIGFRLVWGFSGGHYARFASFAYGPIAGLIYLRQLLARRAPRHVGHNPVASQAVFMLLLLGVVVGLTGVFTQGGEEQQSAAAGWLSIPRGTALKNVHEFGAWLMLALVFAHVTGVIAESWLHHENLALSMLTGSKEAPEGSEVSAPYRAAAGGMILAAAAFGIWWFGYAIEDPVEQRLGHIETTAEGPHVAYSGPKLPDNAQWREECGSCHLAFHPNLLPTRSWQKLMAGQAQHFGVDLALDAPTTAALLAFLVNNAAENSPTEAAWKIDRSIAADQTPLRITDTQYWLEKHGGIAPADWLKSTVKTRANCAACHLDAEAGTYEDAAMRIPG
jgi:cytochrome b